MEINAEKTILLRLNETEAGMLFCVTGLIAGKPASKGRKFMIDVREALDSHGIASVDAFDGELEAL